MKNTLCILVCVSVRTFFCVIETSMYALLCRCLFNAIFTIFFKKKTREKKKKKSYTSAIQMYSVKFYFDISKVLSEPFLRITSTTDCFAYI